MTYLTNKELILVKGGAFSTSMLNAITRTVSTLFSLGQSIGSSIRRVWSKNYC